MEWLLAQAQSASPFIATFCMVMLGLAARVLWVLWRQHLLDVKEIKGLNGAYTKAMTASARALERIAASAERRKRVAQDRRGRVES